MGVECEAQKTNCAPSPKINQLFNCLCLDIMTQQQSREKLFCGFCRYSTQFIHENFVAVIRISRSLIGMQRAVTTRVDRNEGMRKYSDEISYKHSLNIESNSARY